VLLILLVSPALLGTVKCAFVSNPTVAVARIETVDPNTPRVGEIVRFAGTGSGTSPLQFIWDFGDGTSAPGMQAAHSYIVPGSYLVTFTVRDALENVNRDSTTVVVTALIPLSIRLISDAVVGQPVEFAVLPVAEHVNARWTFSDGQSAMGPRVVAAFQAAGTYVVSVDNEQLAFHVMDAPETELPPDMMAR
jgi:hypothetical protein